MTLFCFLTVEPTPGPTSGPRGLQTGWTRDALFTHHPDTSSDDGLYRSGKRKACWKRVATPMPEEQESDPGPMLPTLPAHTPSQLRPTGNAMCVDCVPELEP